jgi:D-threo-aldose 1-dehydrogenase
MDWRGPRPLGGSGVVVTGVGFGGASLASPRDGAGERAAETAVAAALDAGVRYFDVAPRYGLGVAERRLGNALQKFDRSAVSISTKVGWIVTDSGRTPAFSADGVRRSLDDSLRRLKTDHVDIVFVHDPDHHEREALDEVVPTLVRWREDGVIGAIGIGMNYWQPLLRFVERAPIDCLLLASRFTLLEQGALPLLSACLDRGVAVVAGGVFNTGILASGSAREGTYDYKPPTPEILDRVRRLEAVCATHDVPLPAAALQFPTLHPAVASVLIGAGTAERFRRNVDAFEYSVPGSFWTDLADCGFVQLPS